MERGNKEKIIELIKAIENKNSEMEEYLSNLPIFTRNDMLKKISQNIISNNTLLQELFGSDDEVISAKEIKRDSSEIIIESYINKIQENPNRKVIFLREFLELFQDQISEKDRSVILKSLKDIHNKEKLREEMISLANIFEI